MKCKYELGRDLSSLNQLKTSIGMEMMVKLSRKLRLECLRMAMITWKVQVKFFLLIL